MLAELLALYDYNCWAHERTLDATAQLSAAQYSAPLGGSFPSLRATLEHLLGAEAVWLSRWGGDPLGVAPDLSGCADVAALRERWEALWDEQARFLAGLSEDDLDRPVHARFRNGTETVQPLGEMMRHVVNHATFHRGQVVTLTRQLGGTPASTDYIAWCMLRAAGQLPPSSPRAKFTPVVP